MTRVLLATTNRGKLDELRTLLEGSEIDLHIPPGSESAPCVEEIGSTYKENAMLKASAIASWSGGWALADDSGLEVDALGGAPGLKSARYAGPSQDSKANIEKLLRDLRGVPEPLRTARFRCVLALVHPDGRAVFAEGICKGRITLAPSGNGGFGYDPVFFFPPNNCTFAELPPDVKNKVSHRAQACLNLRPQLVSIFSTSRRVL